MLRYNFRGPNMYAQIEGALTLHQAWDFALDVQHTVLGHINQWGKTPEIQHKLIADSETRTVSINDLVQIKLSIKDKTITIKLTEDKVHMRIAYEMGTAIRDLARYMHKVEAE